MLKKLLISMALIFSVGIGISNVHAYSEIGSISVLLEEGVEGTSVKDVEFELIKIGEVTDGLYEYTEAFADEKTDLNEVNTSEELQEVAIKLNKYANENNIVGFLKKTNSTGYLKFDCLEVGIYLLRISDYAKYEYVEPTLISVPTYNKDSQNSMKFDITVIPKHTPFKVEISKQDITTSKELEGAHLEVTDRDGNVVDEWISGKEPHMIQNLYCGKSYILTETIAPKNYKVAQSIEFKIEETGEVQKVVMYDELMPVKVKTGDDTNMILYICLGLGSFALFSILKLRKKYYKQDK